MKLSTSQLILGGYAVALLILGAVALLAYISTQQYVASVTQRRQISNRVEGLASFLSLLKDAENGQRGYLLSNREEHLAPYTEAAATWQDEFRKLRELFDESGEHRESLDHLRSLSQAKMEELKRTIELYRQGTEQSKREVVASGADRELMEQIQKQVEPLERDQRAAFEAVNARVKTVANTTVAAVTILCPLALGLLIGAVVLIQRDLKRRTDAEGALQQQRVLLSAIVNSMNEGVVVADETGELVMFNPAGERLLGRGKASAGSSRLGATEAGVFQADKLTPMPSEDHPLVRALGGESVDFSDMYVQPPGAAQGRFLAGTASPLIDEFGQRRGGVLILRDITERRAAERRFQSLLESAPDALVIVDRQGTIQLVNSQAEQLFGYPRHKLVGQSVELLVPEADRSRHPAQREAFFASPRVRNMGTGLDLQGQRADGTLFPIEISLAPVEGGEQPLVCSAIRDVTDRRRAMEQIRRLNDELEDRVAARTAELATANQELTQRNQENEMFVYSVSHDLRSPLVNLQGFSQELDDACVRLRQLASDAQIPADLRDSLTEVIDSDIDESIHFIRTSVLRLSGIIDALLRLSRAGRVVYQWQRVEVDRIVRRVFDAAHGTITDRQAEVILGELPAASGDPTAVEQVFANLIQNALHYLPHDRPGRIEVGTLEGTTDGLTTYYVRDNGLGIPPGQQSKIFQAFQRLNPQHAPGEGMGLTLVQRIIERHGGRIWVESTVHVGSTFYFTLPPAQGGPVPLFGDVAQAGERL